MTIVTATRLEYSQARAAIGSRADVVRAGIGMARGSRIHGAAISCGLAGGLVPGVATGTVVIPAFVRDVCGELRACDGALVGRLRAAAERLRLPVDIRDVLSLRTFVHGAQRAHHAQGGCVAVDMETAFIAADAIACVRVVLDTPEREISPAWLDGARAAFTPAAWLDLPFLMKNGPRCARTAAEVIAEALR